MFAAMHFAFVAARAHVATEPCEDNPESDEENPAPGYDPLGGGGDFSVEGTLGDFERSQRGVHSQHGVDERDKPAAARSRFEVDANFSNGVFGFHGFPFSGDWLLA
jgi:hypothetical protein